MTLLINQSLFLASGGARDVYIHPENKDWCIKIQRVNGHQNNNEKTFFLTAKENKFLVSYHGTVDTNLGEGLIYDIVRDCNGEISKSLQFHLENQLISLNDAIIYIQKIGQTMLENCYLLHDGGLQNILLQREQEHFTPILIDGFGLKDKDLKYWLRSKISFLASQKTKKQINIMIEKAQAISKDTAQATCH